MKFLSPKTQAIVAGIASGVTGYIAYFIALPPSLQTGIMGQIIAILPAQYQTAAAGIAKTAATFLGFWATYKLSHRPVASEAPATPAEPAVAPPEPKP